MEQQQAKACGHCGDTKPLSEFYRKKNSTAGHVAWCKSCASERKRRNQQLREQQARIAATPALSIVGMMLGTTVQDAHAVDPKKFTSRIIQDGLSEPRRRPNATPALTPAPTTAPAITSTPEIQQRPEPAPAATAPAVAAAVVPTRTAPRRVVVRPGVKPQPVVEAPEPEPVIVKRALPPMITLSVKASSDSRSGTFVLDWERRMARYEFSIAPKGVVPRKPRKRINPMSRKQLNKELGHDNIVCAGAINCVNRRQAKSATASKEAEKARKRAEFELIWRGPRSGERDFEVSTGEQPC
jgi:hypothetical protein